MTRNQLFPNLTFLNVDLAVELASSDAAIILQQIRLWETDYHYGVRQAHKGEYWVYPPSAYLQRTFPWLELNDINNHLDRLVSMGYLIRDGEYYKVNADKDGDGGV